MNENFRKIKINLNFMGTSKTPQLLSDTGCWIQDKFPFYAHPVS
jgi:hypothetical protein